MTRLRIPSAGDAIRVTRGWRPNIWRVIEGNVTGDRPTCVDQGDVLIVLASAHDRSLMSWLLIASCQKVLGWTRAQYMAGDPDTEWYEFVSEIEQTRIGITSSD